jgi:hypothetical protein
MHRAMSDIRGKASACDFDRKNYDLRWIGRVAPELVGAIHFGLAG